MNEDYSLIKNEDGYTVVFDDGKKITISKAELENSIDRPIPKLNWKQKVSSATDRFQLPKPFRALLFLRTEEEKRTYISSLPEHSVESLTTMIAYVILKGNILEKAIQIGVAVPEKLASFFIEIDDKVKKTGEITVNSVKTAVETTKNIVSGTIVILFGIVLFTNPVLLAIILPLFLAADVISLFQDTPETEE